MAPFAVADASPHLAGLLDSQYETLLREWSDRASQNARPALELAAHVPALLRRLIDDLAAPEVPSAAGVMAPLGEGFDLESVVWGYGLLQHLVLELLEGASVPVSMGDVRRLGDWFTRAIAAVAAAHASGARRSSPSTRRRVPDSSRDADTLRSVGLESTAAIPGQGSPVQVDGELLDSRELLDGRELDGQRLEAQALLAPDAQRHVEALLAELTLVEERTSNFLALLAHELRSPMAAIDTSLVLLEQVDGDPAKAARYREIARRQVTSLMRRVDDLLDVAEVSRGKVELRQDDVELGALVQRALGATRPLVETRQHELRVTIAPGAFRLVGDGTRLEQVLVHLITNAAKFTDPGGTISVSLEHELRPESSPPSAWAKLSVHDTGRGIAGDVLGQVFELFEQASPGLDRGTGGLRLGLTLVKHLVEMHGGSVSALSAGRGLGSEFCVRLPLSPARQQG